MRPPRVVVIGGGVSGLAAAWRLIRLRPGAQITVVEAARFGGKLISEHRDGFVVEGAADGFLARKPPALAWAEELGLGTELIEPRPEHRFSHVWWEGALHPMPEGFSGLVPADPEALLRTTLLTAAGASRAAAERTVPPRSEPGEESVASFFTRRYGVEAFERLFEPLLAGIGASDAGQLSVQAAFPQLVAIEARGISLTEGLSGPRASGPAFRSFRNGMAALPERLEAVLKAAGVTLISGEPVTAIEKGAGQERGQSFVVRTANAAFEADAVIVALPPRRAASLLETVSPTQSTVLADWPVSSVANLSLAFQDDQLPNLPPGSGFVAPRAGGTRFSAATWSSRKWPGRAPGDGILVRMYFGGARDPEGWRRSEEDLEAEALQLLAGFHNGAAPKPLWRRVFRWRDGFAQFNLGHAERHEALRRAAVPGLVLAGGYFAGAGIPDCLARAEEAALTVDGFLATGDIEA